MTLRIRFGATATAAGLLFAAPAAAQTPPTAGWQDGFVVQSADGDYRLQIGGAIQTDGRFVVGDPQHAVTDTFVIKKVRPTFSGRIARYFDFKFMPDFAGGTAIVFDAYMDVRFSDTFRIRAGKDKTPVGLELLQGDPYLLFPERSLASSLVPNRDIGFQVQGEAAGGALSYSAGVFNGVPDGTNSTNDLDVNTGKDVAGRILVHPFRSTRQPPSALSGLGFAVGGSSGGETGAALPSFRTSVAQTWFSYRDGAVADGTRRRITPGVSYYHKAFGGFAEYVRSTQRVRRGAVRHDVTNEGWNASGSYVITGEAASDRGVHPAHPFDPPAGHWGALQVLARYSALTVDRIAFQSAFAAAAASREARAFTVGVNWYPTAFIKYYATFERTVFDRAAAAARPPENAILFRVQLAF